MIRVLLAVLIYLIIVAGAVVLQVYLSRMESPWPGRVLPVLSFLLTLAVIAGICVFTQFQNQQQAMGGETVGTDVSDVPTVELPESEAAISASIPVALMLFIWGNIPTALFTIIYFGERKNFRKKKQMERMNIQDLE